MTIELPSPHEATWDARTGPFFLRVSVTGGQATGTLVTPDGEFLALDWDVWLDVERAIAALRESLDQPARAKREVRTGPWTPEEDDTITALWNAGKRIRESAAAVERSDNAVASRLRRLGVADSLNAIRAEDGRRAGRVDPARLRFAPAAVVGDTRLQDLDFSDAPSAADLANHGSPWKPELDEALARDWESGYSLDELVERHQRRPTALLTRLSWIGVLPDSANPYDSPPEGDPD